MLDISRHQGCHRRCWCFLPVSETPLIQHQRRLRHVRCSYKNISALFQTTWSRYKNILEHQRCLNQYWMSYQQCQSHRWCSIRSFWDAADSATKITVVSQTALMPNQLYRRQCHNVRYIKATGMSQKLLMLSSGVWDTRDAATKIYQRCFRRHDPGTKIFLNISGVSTTTECRISGV